MRTKTQHTMYLDDTLFRIIHYRGRKYSKEAAAGNYKKLQRRFHPDKNIENREAATLVTQQINIAYNILNNHESHKEYMYWGRMMSETASVNWQDMDKCLEIYVDEGVNFADPRREFPTEAPDITETNDKREQEEEEEYWRKQEQEQNNRNSYMPAPTEEEIHGEEMYEEETATEEANEDVDENRPPGDNNNSRNNNTRRKSFMKEVRRIHDHRNRKDRGKGLEFKIEWDRANILPGWESADLIIKEFPAKLATYVRNLSSRRQRALINRYEEIQDLIAKY